MRGIPGLRGILVVGLLLLIVPAGADPKPVTTALRPAAADHALLDELHAEQQAPPSRDPVRYLALLWSDLADRSRSLFRLPFGWSPETFLRWVGRGLVTVAALALLWLLALWLRSRIRRPGARSADPTMTATETVPELYERDGDDWRRELDERLAAGDPRGALEALWWWLGHTVTRTLPDPGWTSRELLRRGRRPDLLPEVRHLDRLRYGPIAASAEQVRRLASHLTERLAERPA